MSEQSKVEVPYSFVFDRAKDSWICSVHGEVDSVAWVRCYAYCDEGVVDEYEDDPINEDPGTFSDCPECNGNGGWSVCAECNAKNLDAEF